MRAERRYLIMKRYTYSLIAAYPLQLLLLITHASYNYITYIRIRDLQKFYFNMRTVTIH